MTQSVLRFALQPGKREEFVATFRRLAVLETSSHQAGWRGGQLLLDVSDPDAALVIARWDSPAAYQGWLDNPAREEIGGRLEPFLATDPQGGLVDLVYEVGA
jgi:heme-degrading monooxygenase HmoA